MTERTEGRVYSQDYWDIVLAQLKRRPSVFVSTVLLAIMYAIAIYAPLLANDRPLYVRGVDLADFRNAQRELITTSGALERALSGATDAATVSRESEAVALRLERMIEAADPADAAPFQALAERVEQLSVSFSEGDTDEARRAAEAINAEAVAMRDRYRAIAPGTDAPPGREGVTLVPSTSYPVFSALSRGEVFFMALWALVLTFPLWNRIVDRAILKGDLFRMRNARRPKALAFLVLPALVAILWPAGKSSVFSSDYKTRLADGDIIAERVIFPIVPFGIAETNGSEHFRPPTWHRESIKDEDGFYMYGPRAGRFDAATGLPKMAHPVIVRGGEPGPNDARRHSLGTDSLGRDLLARLVWGARISLSVGLVSTALLVVIGTFFGALAGYYGGWIDIVISRIIEIVQTFPFFFLVLIIVAFIGPSVLNIMLGIGLIRWTGVARLVRGEFIRLREQDFVVASRALGVPSFRTIFRHVLPNAMGPVLVAATFSVAAGILTESGLSFLGFGVQLPVPSWGSLFIESRAAEHWWIQIYPGLLIFITVMLYNLLGEGIRDALDPRLKVH